ncbi:sodium-independent sulfate anion transporter-like isoform X1 [Trichogramma pretiosum]|uniref:sodium-independent sulfate anion transporter-like isoform X1 n=1 Tax=Trichogramma pretiosum TaxID=7493 RepID=UPI0006C95DD0|nr:sodium-independent sulfate anion transporter-like isoform X1 [Trichogramma pretiosum]
MKKEHRLSDGIMGKSIEGGYVNHALSESQLDLGPHHNGLPTRHTHYTNAYTNGSSDFVLLEDPTSVAATAGVDDHRVVIKGGCSDDTNSSNSTSSTKERLSAIGNYGRRQWGRLSRACNRKTLYKRLPVLNWLPRYNGQDALGDLVAGVTVGLTVIPQSLAYSSVAGLPPQYGLYGSFLGCFLYILFGSCKDVPFGPTAIVSLLTYQTVNHLDSPHLHAILLCFIAGLVELLMGAFGLGFLIDFVSGPVSSGFTSAVALIIVTSQVKDVLGIKASGTTFMEMWSSIIDHASEAKLYDASLGLSCIALLLVLRMVASLSFGTEEQQRHSTPYKILNKCLWLMGTSRNALLVVICGCIAYSFPVGQSPFNLIGDIPSGMPAVQLPPFGYTKDDNTTVSLWTMCENLGSGIIVVPLISLMEDIAICKAFANGKSVDATQELIAIGAANIGNSFVQAFPGSGSLSRSAVNNASGVRTTLGGVYTGILVILALCFLTPYFFFIPKAALAAIIIAAVIFMVEVKVIKPMWRTKKTDLVPGISAFVFCLLLPLEIGIGLGVAINILFILYHAARPKIDAEKMRSRQGIEYLMLTPDRCLIFPSVDYVRNLVTKYGRREAGETMPVVIDCSHVFGADYTAAKVIESLIRDFSSRGQSLFFYNLKPSVYAVFEGVEPADFVCYYTQEALDELFKERESNHEVRRNFKEVP